MSTPVRLDRDGDVAVVVLDRPERRNALNEPLWRAVREAAEALAAHPPRVAIVTGAGDHFCSGMDLSPENALAQRLVPAVLGKDADAIRGMIVELKAIFDAVAGLPFPTIAAIDGACYGSGLELALACDLRVASEGAKLALMETRYGMVPDVGGTVRLARLVGRSRATDMVLTSRTVDAAEALRTGLVDRVVPGRALEAARKLADEIVANAPTANREILAVLRRVDELDDDAAFAAETEAGVRTLLSGEVVEGITAFAMKNKPKWTTSR